MNMVTAVYPPHITIGLSAPVHGGNEPESGCARLEAECAGAPPIVRNQRARRHSFAPLGSCLPAQFHLPRHLLVDGVRFLLRQSALFHMPHV